jgi:hypothetical protein
MRARHYSRRTVRGVRTVDRSASSRPRQTASGIDGLSGSQRLPVLAGDGPERECLHAEQDPRQTGHLPTPSATLCRPPPRARSQRPHGAGAPRTPRHDHDNDLHPRPPVRRSRRAQSTRRDGALPFQSGRKFSHGRQRRPRYATGGRHPTSRATSRSRTRSPRYTSFCTS